jgi:hypothetical protein
VWQPVQPDFRKSAFPATGSPFSLKAAVAGSSVGFGTEPMIVRGAGDVTPFEPHPATTATVAKHVSAVRIVRRTVRDNTAPHYHPS